MKRQPPPGDRANGHGSSDDADRRIVPRVTGSPPLAVAGIHATVHDVSRAGISLALLEPVRPGYRCRLTLVDQLDGSLQEIEAEAIWCRPDRAGFRWIGLSEEQDRWLGRRFSAWLAAPEIPSSA